MIAADSGCIWLTTDGGDGMLGISAPFLSAGNFAKISTCSRDSALFTLGNASCYRLIIDTTTLDSIEYFSLSHLPSFPDTLKGGSIDSIWLHFDPHFLAGQHGTNLHLSGKLESLSGLVPYDTIIRFSATASAVPPALAISSYDLQLGTVSLCSFADTSLIFKNIGCDTLQIDSLQGVLSNGLSFVGATFPLRIAPDSQYVVRVQYKPTGPGSLYVGYVCFASAEGLHTSTNLIIEGKAIAGEGRLSVASLRQSFPPTSICSSHSTSFTFYNSGCDTLVIISENLAGDSDFASNVVGQTMLAPGDSVTVHIYLNPKLKGLRVASYSLKSHSIKDPSSEQDTTILFSATIISGNRICSIDSTLRNFGVGSVCRVADTTIIFKNTGCDSMTVRSVVVNGQNFTLLSSNAPKQLASGMSDTIRVAYLPTSAGNDSATLLLQTNADQDSVVNIPFTAKTVAPQRLTLQTSLSRNNITTGDTTTLFVTPTQTVTVAGLTSLSCTISYDGDLLTYISNSIAVAPGFTAANPVETRSGKTSTLKLNLNTTGNPTTFTKATTLASVRFGTTLTDSLSSPIVLGNISLNNGDSLFNKCSLSITDTSTNFTLALNCFDSTINAALRGVLPFVVQSIVPNPTNGKLTVTLANESKQPVVYDLYDALGHDVQHGSFGEVMNTLDLNSLPSGSYYLRMTGSGEIQSRRIVLQR